MTRFKGNNQGGNNEAILPTLVSAFFIVFYSHWDREQSLEQTLETRVSLLLSLRAPSPAVHTLSPRAARALPPDEVTAKQGSDPYVCQHQQPRVSELPAAPFL